LASLEHDRIPSSRPIAVREIPLIDRVEEMRLLKAAVDRTVARANDQPRIKKAGIPIGRP